MDTCQAFDQCTISRSIFSEKCMDLSRFQGKIHIVQRFYTGKLYFNAFHFKQIMIRQLNSSLRNKGERPGAFALELE